MLLRDFFIDTLLRFSVLFCCKNAENGVSQNAGQLLTHTVTHTRKCADRFKEYRRGGVGVGAKGESGVVVAQHAADGFDVYSVLKRQGCEGVSEIMEANVWQSRIF